MDAVRSSDNDIVALKKVSKTDHEYAVETSKYFSSDDMRKDLATLRQLASGEIDIERAASSIVGKLISLEMVRSLRFSPLPRLSSLIKYNAALGLLQDMRQPLIALYHSSPPDATGLAPLDLLGLPLPQNSISDLHLNLVSTYFLHVMQVLLHTVTDVSAFAAALHHPATPTLLA